MRNTRQWQQAEVNSKAELFLVIKSSEERSALYCYWSNLLMIYFPAARTLLKTCHSIDQLREIKQAVPRSRLYEHCPRREQGKLLA
jgi:hypothetical protein